MIKLTFSIDKATTAQAKDIGYVHAMSWQKAYTEIIPSEYLRAFTPAKRACAFSKAISEGGSEFYVGYLDQRPIGLLILGKSRDSDVYEGTG